MPDSNMPADFQLVATPDITTPAVPGISVSLPIDADVLAFFQSELTGNWRQHMTGVLRNFMESHRAMEADFEATMTAQKSGPDMLRR